MQEFKITVKTSDNLPPLRNPDILLGENDLTSLSYLHEPAGIVIVRNKTLSSVSSGVESFVGSFVSVLML